MKKLLSVILCLCMLASVGVCVPFVASAAEDESLTTDKQTLKKFGFDIDESAFNLNALKPGTHAVETQNELVVTTSYPNYTTPLTMNMFYEFEKDYVETIGTGSYGIITRERKFKMKEMNDSLSFLMDKNTPAYFITSSFDPDCSGMKAYTAKLSVSNSNGGVLSLKVYPSNSAYASGAASVGVSSITSASEIKMWLVEGLLSMATGDFDGDSREEIAVYAPDNSNEIESKRPNTLDIVIYSYDPAENKLTEKQRIDLTDMGETGKTCTWNNSYYKGNREYFNLPYVALTADDVNGDGIDDLMAVLNFSTEFNGVSSSTRYTTAQVLDPTTCWASLLEVYEGTQEGLVNTVMHRPLVANGSGDNSDNRYVIRHANAIVADVTAEGSKEIVIGGRYTSIVYKNATGTTKVNTTRESYRDNENYVFGNILGYADYNTVKAYNPYQEGAAYQWVTQKSTTDTLRHYEFSMNNPIQQPVSLCGYKYNGFGYPDRIFMEGQYYSCDADTQVLELIGEITPSGTKKSSSTNRWYGKAVAANACDNKFGTEILAVTYFNKISEKEEYYAYVTTLQPNRRFLGVKPYTLGNATFPDDELLSQALETFQETNTIQVPDVGGTAKYHVCLAWGDLDDDSTFIRYENGDTDVYYSKVEALAIMQAPPLYEELNDDTYLGNSATSFAKTKGEGSGSSLGGSLTAGVVAGFEQETSFLGLFKVAGGEFELKVTATASYDKATSTSFDYSTGFETSGTTDAVAIFTVPYVRYNCEMIMPEYQIPTEEEYNIKKAFRDELKANLEAYEETNVDQVKGTYAWCIKEYDYMYHSRVMAENYGEQLGVLDTVSAEVDAIEKAVAACGKGGDKNWGEIVENTVLPYHYCVPQAPLVTTVDVETYDAMADYLGLDKISEKVFNAGYMAGDPNTYAHDVSQLKKGSGKVLEGRNTVNSSNDGFLSNSNISAPGTIQSQTISVEQEDEQTLGWAAGIESTTTVNAGGAFAGITASAEINGSYVWTKTTGNEYSGAVVALPEGTNGDYSYNWKLIAYNGKLNGKEVPVVGYLTRVTATAPPSIAQNISVEGVTDKTATITWEDGNRAADYYKLSRVYTVNGVDKLQLVATNITGVDGKYSYTITNLASNNESYYVLESCKNVGSKVSVPTDRIIITTFPENFAAEVTIGGMKENVIYRSGKVLNMFADVTGNEGYDTLYQWQVNDGSGWEDVSNLNNDAVNIELSPFDNGNKIRCSAIVMVGGTTACVVYSDPITINCARSYGGYEVDWEDTKIIVTKSEDAEPGTAYLGVYDSKGAFVDTIIVDGEADLSKYLDKGYEIRLFIWKDNLTPITLPFER